MLIALPPQAYFDTQMKECMIGVLEICLEKKCHFALCKYTKGRKKEAVIDK